MRRFLFAAALMSLVGVQAIRAAEPAFSGTTPRGGQRGTDLEVVFSGARLEDAKEILFYEPGITVTSFAVVDGGNVKVTFKIAPDCQLGSHRMRIRTATGISDLRPFFVSNLPFVAEVEPNSDFKQPQSIATNVTVSGRADNEDVDYYVVEAKKGDRITAEVEAIRLGITLFDVYVAIMNEARFELSASDDAALVWQDGIASIVAPADGKYIIQVRESSYGGNGACLYHVHIGNFPRPRATIPAGGKAGEQVAVKFLGDVGGPMDQTFALPGAAMTQLYTLFATDPRGVAPSPNWFRVSEYGNVIEAEPNNDLATATKFAPPIALNGVLDADDKDFFRFAAKQGETYDIRVYGRQIRSPIDPVLVVYNAQGGGITSNDDSGGPDSYVRFAAPAEGEFLIEVRDHLGKGGPEYAYRVELTPVKPRLGLSLAEFVQYVQPTASVPKGNRFALMVNASRVDFGGPLALKGVDLPAGVTLECLGMQPGMSTVPVLFHAAADAAPAGALVDLVATLNDPAQPNLQVEGHLQQDIALVRGQNNIPFWIESVHRLATAVTDEVPFAVQIVEPKVPLVHNGQMELKVVATRKEGYTAPIKVDLLYFPPGVNASRSISIAEGQTEALIPMNAAGNAQVGEWPIIVTGQAAVGNGQIMVASTFAKLRVAEQYLTFAYEQSAVEQGKETDFVVKVNKAKDFEGPANVTLIGLPAKTTTMPLQVTKDLAELVFKVKTEPEAPAGTHKNLFCQVIVMENGEPITHNLGAGQLRIDVPLPPKKDEPPPMPAAAPAPAAPKPAEAPPMKRLTRLEQLRVEQAEREKAKAAEKK